VRLEEEIQLHFLGTLIFSARFVLSLSTATTHQARGRGEDISFYVIFSYPHPTPFDWNIKI
jgi:hypothetical protein